MKLTACLISLLVVGATAAPANAPGEEANLEKRTILTKIRCIKGGGHFDLLRKSCICPSGLSWDDGSGRCQQSQPQCPAGQYWDAPSGRCRNQVQQCPDGQYWDIGSDRCAYHEGRCPDGQYWDTDSNRCELEDGCPDGQYWSKEKDCCVSG